MGFMVSRNYQQFNGDSFASDIVKQDYRTAQVFHKLGIEFCCGVKWPLKMVCDLKGLDLDYVLAELENATRIIRVSSSIPFEEWGIDFLTEYIIKIHHNYLVISLPRIQFHLEKFVDEHKKKYPYLEEVGICFSNLYKVTIPHLQQEEEIIFPYIRHIAHAYHSKESYASLLVRTLRKPVDEIMQQEHEVVEKIFHQIRNLTNNYQPPESSCTSHQLSYSLLKELDDDFVQHIYLENEILFPRAIAMEKELLQR